MDPVAGQYFKRESPDFDLAEGQYNARDVLSMCRIYKPLAEAIQRTNTVDVYLADRAMAHLALQMTRAGMPVDDVERQRVGAHLRELRDAAEVELRKCTDEPYRARFVEEVARLMASRVRKNEPEAGQSKPDGAVHSHETAMLARIEIRKAEFEKKVAKKGVNFGAKVQQAALLRVAGVPLLKITPKSGLPKISKETLEEFSYHAAARAMLSWSLTSAALRTFIDGLKVDADGRLRPDWSVHKISGRWGSSPNCFDGGTEILTERGWVRFADLRKGVRVAQYAAPGGAVDFVRPARIVKYRHRGNLLAIKRRNIDLLVTEDHRLLLQRRSGAFEDRLARDFVGDRRMFTVGQHAFGDESRSAVWISLLCAAQADGCWNGSGWVFGFTRRRKIQSLVDTLDTLGLAYTKTRKRCADPFKPGRERFRTIFYVKKSETGSEIHRLLGPKKSFGPWLLKWNKPSILDFLDEIMRWDGSWTRRNCYASSVKANADWVQALFVLTGRRARIRAYRGSPAQKKVNWQVDVSLRKYTWTTNAQVRRVKWNAPVYCVSVPSSYIMVRRNGNVMVVGQCQNWSKRAGGGVENLRRMIAAPSGYIFVGADQKQLEARLIAACSQDPFLLDVFRRNADIHGELAGVAFPAWPKLVEVYNAHKNIRAQAKVTGIGCGFSKEQPYCDMCTQRDKVRDLTKRLEYGAFYGGSVQTLWSSVVKDFPELQPHHVAQFIRQLGSKMDGVVQWRTRVLRDAVERGEIRSPILGRREVFPLGRVEPTVAYNYLPQSGGADIWALGAIEFMNRWPQDGDDARIVHNGHDSVLILCKEASTDAVVKDVHVCWERVWNGVEFLMDCKVGRRWSEV